MSILPLRAPIPMETKILMERLGFNTNHNDQENWHKHFELMIKYQEQTQALNDRVNHLEALLNKECD